MHDHARPLRLLTFNYEYPPLGGGGGVFHKQIAESLAKRHHVVVVTSAFGDLPRRERVGGVEIRRVPIVGRGDPSAASLASMLSYPPAAWLEAARLMRGTKFDLVHGHFAVPTGPASLPPAIVGGIPHVLTIQGGDIYDPSKKLSPHRSALLRAAVTRVMRGSSAVVAASRNIVENAYRWFSYRGPIETIPLAIDPPPEVPRAGRAALGLPEGALLAVTVGRLVRRKGLDRLLEALARPECRAIHLAIIGSGPEEVPLRALAGRLGITTRVRFLGRVDDRAKWQILDAADFYASASLHEGFGLVYLEAMASGLAVVAPDEGGQTDFLQDGSSGYVVKAGDPRSLVDGLSRAASRRHELEVIGRRNRQRAAAFSIERCAAAYERLFERVLRGARAKAGRRQPSSPAGSGLTGATLLPGLFGGDGVEVIGWVADWLPALVGG
ncbi:MAG: glycosyltransferase family 4 protein [Hyphomicrobiales bacterium]